MNVLLTMTLFLAQAGQGQPIYEEFKVSVHQIHVNVTDNAGNPIRDLTKDDFIVELEGEPQPIETVQFISLLRDVLEAPLEAEPEKEGAAPIPEHGRRLFVLLFDVQFNSRRGLMMSKRAARNFIDNDLLETDLAAVFAIRGDYTHMAVNFTNDPEQLHFAVNSLGFMDNKRRYNSKSGFMPASMVRESNNRFEEDNEIDDIGSIVSLVGGELGQDLDPTIQALQRRGTSLTMRYLKTFRAFGESLSILKGRKNLIYFSEGYADNSAWILRYTRELVEQLQGAGTVVFAVDTSRPGFATEKGNLDLLNNIASTSGGRIYTNYNRLDKPLQKIESSTSDYYLVNIRTELDLPKGVLADVKVRVKRPGVKIFAPKGLLINPDHENSSPLERKLLLSEFISKDQVALPIPIGVMANQVPHKDGSIRLNVITEIDGDYFLDHAAAAKEMGFELFTIAINKKTNQLEDEKFQSFNVTPSLPKGASKHSAVKYFADLTLPPGSFKIKTIVRNVETGLISCLIRDVDLYAPELSVVGPIPVTTEPALLIRHQVVVGGGDAQPTSDFPYSLGNAKFIPAVDPILSHRGEARLMHLLDPEHIKGNEHSVELILKLADANGKIKEVPADAFITRIALPPDGKGNSFLLTSVQLASLGLQEGSTYQFLSTVHVGDKKPVKGTYTFETAGESGS